MWLSNIIAGSIHSKAGTMHNDNHLQRLVFVGFLGLILTVFLSAVVTWHSLLHQTEEELEDLSENTLYTVEGYLSEAESFLDMALNRKPLDCSLKSREVFIPKLLSAVVVTDIIYTLPDKTLCSLTYGDSISPILQKRLVTQWKGMDLFILADDVLATGKGNVLVGKEGVFALLPQQQLARFYIMEPLQHAQLRLVINNETLIHSAHNECISHCIIVRRIAKSGVTVEFALPFIFYRSFWLSSFWPTQWAVNSLLLLSFGVFFYIYVRYRSSMKTAIRWALKKKVLCVYYQPIIEIETGRIHSLEALIRWPTTSGEMIPVDEFIPVAERSGLICSITEYVLHQVMVDMRIFHQTHPELVIAVNISAADLAAPNFVVTLRTWCADSLLSPHYLKLEITERSLVDDEIAKRNMQSLLELGVKFALDDFGTGYSSLSYVNKLPVQTLKIDRSFIFGLGMDTVMGSVVPQIVSIAQQLSMEIIAEGVETKEQAVALSHLEVRYAQGWLYEKAMPFVEIQKKLCINDRHPYRLDEMG